MNQTEPDTFFDPVECVDKYRVTGEVKAVPVKNYATYCRVLEVIGENPGTVAAKTLAVEIDMHVRALKILAGYLNHDEQDPDAVTWAKTYAEALLVKGWTR